MANYTVVDGTHLQMTLNKVHQAGATIAFGGLCGYGLEQTVDTVGPIRQVFPVIGSYSATGLYYAGGLTAIVGVQGNTSAFLNVTLPIAAIARNNNLVTVTTAGNLPVDVNGLTMTRVRSGGPELQRQLCGDFDGTKYADLCADRRQQHEHRRYGGEADGRVCAVSDGGGAGSLQRGDEECRRAD